MTAGESSRRTQTNVLFILTDDQGPWAAGCYGNPEIRTPNIDRLAASGLRLRHFFVATPVCSPSRATLLTGRIPSQHGVHDWLRDGNTGPDAIRYLEGQITSTDLLARAGWTCALSGKWHLGDSQVPQHGFSRWFVHQKGGGRYNDAPMVRDGQLVDEPGYVTDNITNQAVAWLDDFADRGTPFYLGVHYTAPHSPWTGHPQSIVESYNDCAFASCPQEVRHPWATTLTDECHGNREMLKGYFAAVTAMDLQVGRLLDRLEARGLRERTLVIFLSDNGFSCGQHGFWGKGNGTNPRNMYENSIRVPAIFSQPGIIAPGRVDDTLLSAYDIAPTLLDYLGLPSLEGTSLPGHSFAPLLRGDPLPDREHIVIFDEYGPVRMLRTREWKYVYRHAYGPHELYDLIHDPDERQNLIGEQAQFHRVIDMKADMDAWFARYVVPARDGLRRDGTETGQTGLAEHG